MSGLEQTHTAGPWHVSVDHVSKMAHVYANRTTTRQSSIADIDIVESIHGRGNDEANARLMASAPDMLEVLKEVAECIRNGSDWFQGRGRVAKYKLAMTIAKAEGQ